DRCAPCVEIVLIFDEGDVDAKLLEGVLEEVVRSTIDRRRGGDVVTRARNVEEGKGDCRLATRKEQGSRAERASRDPLLGSVLRRVHDAGVDVAGFGECEQIRGVISILKDVRGGLVNGERASSGGGVRLLATVNLLGFKSPVCFVAHAVCAP